MLVSLMLPISIICRKAFKDFLKVFDPSFIVPTRKTVKTTGLNVLLKTVYEKIGIVLKSMSYVNVSVDGWSDSVMRCFNGYIVQGIDSNWKLHTIPIAFQYVSGRHTGKAIKSNMTKYQKNLRLTKRHLKLWLIKQPM